MVKTWGKSPRDVLATIYWGKPYGYDIKINRTGEGLETEYTVSPKPKTELSDEQKKAQTEMDKLEQEVSLAVAGGTGYGFTIG